MSTMQMQQEKTGVEVAVVRAVYRYPVKSMKGHSLEECHVDWNGLDGDRRYAFVQRDSRSDFPWLTGRNVPGMTLYEPYFIDPADVEKSPVRVRTPSGDDFDVTGPELMAELSAAHGTPLHLLRTERGTFDNMPVSLISTATVQEIGEYAGLTLEGLRFRPNILLELLPGVEGTEDDWMDAVLVFGTQEAGLRMRANRQNVRCMMINLDPATARQAPAVLRQVVARRGKLAGIYASVEKPGLVRVGDVVRLSHGLGSVAG